MLPLSDRIATINGLRGLAALGVFFVHTLANFTTIGGLSVHGFSLGSVIWAGWIGVNLFFVLSGFVLYLPYADGRLFNTRDFYKRRIWRLAPLYLSVTILCVSLWGTWDDLVKALTITYYLLPPYGVPGNDPLWSIAVEIYLSALFPLLVLVFRSFGTYAVVASVVMAPSLRMLYGITFYTPGEQGITFPWNLVLIAQSANEFLLGMWLAHAFRNDTLPTTRGLFWISAIGILATVGFVNVSNQPGPALNHAAFFLLDPLLAFLVAGALVKPVLTSRPIQILGMMCFSFYVWHLPILSHMANYVPHYQCCGNFIWIGWLPVYASAFIAIALVAAITYRFIEFPKRSLNQLFMLRGNSRRRIDHADLDQPAST